MLFTTDGDQSGFVLLQRANGKQYRMTAEPILSPDRKHLVTVDVCAKLCDGEITVWRVTRDDVAKELAWKPQPPWSDANATWTDADTIRFDYATEDGERRKKLEGSIIEIEAQITEAREAVATAEQEVSVVEAAGTHRATANGNGARRLRRL